MAVSAMLAACGSEPGPAISTSLAADQTLRLAVFADPATLDPALVSAGPDGGDILVRNVFDGLYRWEDPLHEQPDLAAGMPSVSADRRTYTIRLRSGIHFSNGDGLTSADVVYSWNRAIAKQGQAAILLGPIAGYDDVATGRAITLSGLSAPDPTTLVVTLSHPDGSWIAGLAEGPTWVVDRRVIEALGEQAWWTTPNGLVGTGPFRLTSRVPGRSLDFAPVPGWWGGATGSLHSVRIDIVGDLANQLSEYLAGRYDAIGYGEEISAVRDLGTVQQIVRSQRLYGEVLEHTFSGTRYLGFNLAAGPLAGDPGRTGRLALSLAIDRRELADRACSGGSTCVGATGGLICKGLDGFLGEGNDPGARFDAAQAKRLYHEWDPMGQRLTSVELVAFPQFKPLADEIHRQWIAHLGLDVPVKMVDSDTFFHNLQAHAYTLFLSAWHADYNSPADWYDNLFVTAGPQNGGDYSSPQFDSAVQSADALLPAQSREAYRHAAQVLFDDSAYAALTYFLRVAVAKPYLRGAGFNAMYETPWTGVSILRH